MILGKLGLGSRMAVDCTQLPEERLQPISDKLIVYGDYVRFRAVSKVAILSPNFSAPPSTSIAMAHSSALRIPITIATLLLWPLFRQDSLFRSPKSFWSLYSHWLLQWLAHPPWQVPNHSSPQPSNSGQDLLPSALILPNVLSFDSKEYKNQVGNRTSLLSLSETRDSFIKNIVLQSAGPLNDNFIVVAILDKTNKLAYCKNGDQSLTFMPHVELWCCDVTYFKDHFFAVDKLGRIVVRD